MIGCESKDDIILRIGEFIERREEKIAPITRSVYTMQCKVVVQRRVTMSKYRLVRRSAFRVIMMTYA